MRPAPMNEVMTEDPGCDKGREHAWRNPDPQGWAGRCLTPNSPTVTYIRVCKHCGVEQTTLSPVQECGVVVEDKVTYEYPEEGTTYF